MRRTRTRTRKTKAIEAASVKRLPIRVVWKSPPPPPPPPPNTVPAPIRPVERSAQVTGRSEMRTKDRPGGDPKGQKQDGRDSKDQNQQTSHR